MFFTADVCEVRDYSDPNLTNKKYKKENLTEKLRRGNPELA